MSTEKHELETMDKVSLDVQFFWTMGIMAKMLKITKKTLREAKRIIDVEIFKDEISVKGSLVEMTFLHGFRSFVLKRKAKRRKILAPHPKLQVVFKAFKDILVELDSVHEKAFGFVKKRNVQMATRSLLGNTHFLSFDIADAFPSITAEMAEEALKRIKIDEELILPLAWLITYYYAHQRRLPQGSSCSPALLNLVYGPMCQEIDKICKINGIEWFVYADDFNFAGLVIKPEVKNKLFAIPVKHGFSVEPKKIKDNLGKTIPHILGLTIVNGKIHIRRCTKKKFRRILYMAWRYGVYSSEQVIGVAAAVRQTYGKEKNWPGWIRKFWIEYQAKQEKGGSYDKDN